MIFVLGLMKEFLSDDILLEGCPKNFTNILACLRLWNYFTKPDYEFIRNVFKECMVQRNIRETEPYDWENMVCFSVRFCIKPLLKEIN
uniref:Uncharacterized protein n=1 Tax=Acrobeloides nanus TaxID=290746 RepID=A0A914EHB2_9BILA